jgi:hypothetical protein
MYVEDDMLVPYENFLNFVINFYDVSPKYVPSFVRIEEQNGVLYNTDNMNINNRNISDIISIQGKKFISLDVSYHAFWILPKSILKKHILAPSFSKTSTHRELAASFCIWELNKTGLIELDTDMKISKLCYAFHLPNNYVTNPSSAHGKIKIDELLFFKS